MSKTLTPAETEVGWLTDDIYVKVRKDSVWTTKSRKKFNKRNVEKITPKKKKWNGMEKNGQQTE